MSGARRPDDAAPARGPYDPAPKDEADLWFLPAPDPEAGADDWLPWPRAGRRVPFDPAAWRAAQDALSGELAALACLFGALDERLRAGGEGLGERLALMETETLGWWTGERVGMDRLVLWAGMRLPGVQEDSLALARAGWAARRLTGGPGPEAGGWEAGVLAFLGRGAAFRDAGAGVAEAGLADAVAELVATLEAASVLHPAVRAAVLFETWKRLRPGPAGELEAAVMAARHGATMAPQSERPAGRRGAAFLPVALAAPGALRASGPLGRRLSAWLAGAETSVLAALLHLDRVAAWRERAAAAVSALSGRTPPRLVRLFADRPVVSAPLAEAATGASRAAVQRNLHLLEEKGLIREITGQARYRAWAARIGPAGSRD